MPVNLAKTERKLNRPHYNTARNRARGYRLLAELSKLANLRISRQELLDWPTWSFCMAATFFAVLPGKKKAPQFHRGVLLQGMYYAVWPECDVAAMLTRGSQALFSQIDEVPREIITDVEKAIERARLSPIRGFMTGDVIGRFLKIRREEVELLGLRLINGIDFTSADRLARRKGSSVQRSEAYRRARGAIPVEVYRERCVSTLSPWDHLGISRASFYRKPKEERDQIIETLRCLQAGKKRMP